MNAQPGTPAAVLSQPNDWTALSSRGYGCQSTTEAKGGVEVKGHPGNTAGSWESE